jgi:hypothetical protein
MLPTDVNLDASTAIAAGTNATTTYSLLSNEGGQSLRSAAALSLTNPRNLSVKHSVRTGKTFRTAANASVPASDIIFDRHLIRLDTNMPQSTHLDQEFRINRSIQIVIEVPRIGGSSPTSLMIADDLKALVAFLDSSTRANLVRLMNGEV